MTTEVAEQAAETTTEEAPKVQTFKDDLQKLQFESLSKMLVERNDLVGRVNAANGDRQSLTEQIRENSQDPDIVEAREQLSKWVLRLDELVKPIVDKHIEDSAGSVKELEEKIKEADGALKPGLTYYKKMYGEEAAEFFPKQSRLAGASVRSTGGGRRIRGFNVVVTIDGDTMEHENFSGAAKYIGCETGELQGLFFEKAGTDDPKKLPDEVSFVVNFEETDKDGHKEEKSAFVKAYKTDDQKASDSAGSTTTSDEPEPESNDEGDEPNLDEDELANAL